MMRVDANTRLALKLAGAALAMFGFGYALVPLYSVFCELTGLNGKTGQISAAEAAALTTDAKRIVTVEFDTNVNGALPWAFRPLQRRVQVHPGEMGEALFAAENVSDRTVVGQAVPSVAPAKAAVYFNKTECFCFTQQMLAPGERREMPVRFIVDPRLPADVTTLVLSYTFFEAPGTVGTGAPAENNTKQRS